MVNGEQREGLLGSHSIHRSVETRRDPPRTVSRRRHRRRHSKATPSRNAEDGRPLNSRAIARERSLTRTRISLLDHRSVTLVYESENLRITCLIFAFQPWHGTPESKSSRNFRLSAAISEILRISTTDWQCNVLIIKSDMSPITPMTVMYFITSFICAIQRDCFTRLRQSRYWCG